MFDVIIFIVILFCFIILFINMHRPWDPYIRIPREMSASAVSWICLGLAIKFRFFLKTSYILLFVDAPHFGLSCLFSFSGALSTDQRPCTVSYFYM